MMTKKRQLAIWATVGLLCGCFLSVEVTVGAEPVVEWEKTFGGSGYDHGYNVQQTTDGGYIISGWTNSSGAGGSDVYLIKTDSSGNKQWERTFGGSGNESGGVLRQTSDGGYIITGQTSSFGAGSSDAFLIKTDSDGNPEWEPVFRTFGGAGFDTGQNVKQTADGGYIIAGQTNSFGAGSWDAYLVKTDSDGNLVWQRTFGGSDQDHADSVQQTPDGGYIIAGLTRSFGAGSGDAYLIKTDFAGNLVWQQTFGGAGNDFATSLDQAVDGGYIIAGGTNSFGAGSTDVYVVKTDSAGNLLWQSTSGGTSSDDATWVESTTDGGAITTGGTNSFGAGIYDVYLVKIDSGGNKQWEKTLGGINDEAGYALQQTTDGGYIIAGITNSYGAGSYDFYLIKLRPESIVCTIDIDPDTLALSSKDKWVTCYIELPDGYDVMGIDGASVTLEGIPAYIGAEGWARAGANSSNIMDHDGDGIRERMVKFDKAPVQNYLIGLGVSGYVGLTVTGDLVGGPSFEGIDVIRVIK